MNPTECAQKLIERFNITTTPALVLNSIYERLNIICIEREFDDYRYMGSLHRRKDEAVIIINADIKNHGRINFTKAHELGHFSLDHKGQQFDCNKFDLSSKAQKPMEVEANQFARAFLLPDHMVRPICLSAPFDFVTIRAISDQFLVSKLTAVFRVLDFHVGNYAFVYSQDGKIKHSKLSNSLAGKINLKNVGELIDLRSQAYSVLYGNDQFSDYSSIDPSVWIRRNRTSGRIALKENSRANQKYRTVMTLLKVDLH